MKLYLIFIVFLLSSLYSYEVEGIRLEKVITISSGSNDQEIIKISSIKRHDYDHESVAKTDEVTSGVNRKLMTKIASSSTTTTNSKNQMNEETKNDPKSKIKSAYTFNLLPESFQHEKDVANEPYPNDIDIVDYTPARQKSPIHN